MEELLKILLPKSENEKKIYGIELYLLLILMFY